MIFNSTMQQLNQHLMVAVLLLICSYQVSGQDTTRVSLLFLGDIMQHDSQIQAAYNPSTGLYDYTECFKMLKPYFQSADLTLGNLELTLAGKPFKGYPQFSAPDELAVALKNVGVDVLVTANNHSVDRRRKGLERTIRVLDSLGILHTGTFRDTVERMNDYPLIIDKNGVKLALLNYTYGTNGIPVTKPNIVNPIDTALIRKDLERARELEADASIVFMHWGDEYQSQPNKTQRQLASHCFEHGATLVIGAHPHVLQPMEWDRENNQLVVYSLGNFVSGQRTRYRDGGGMLKVQLNKVMTDSTSRTSIDTANYMLQWVYKTIDSKRNFHVLPVSAVEHDPADFIHDEVSRQAFKTFVEDSRKLLGKFNKGIGELNVIPPDTVIRHKVLLIGGQNSAVGEAVMPHPHTFVFGMEAHHDESGTTHWYTGNFEKWEAAERYRQQLSEDWPDCKVVTFINGKPASD
jgi:poly-gamma-glutamate capsule biosynthesis protein CapA/YwtB (metallophosphatase superfamily)